jgi:hypothetical protein
MPQVVHSPPPLALPQPGRQPTCTDRSCCRGSGITPNSKRQLYMVHGMYVRGIWYVVYGIDGIKGGGVGWDKSTGGGKGKGMG